MVLVPRCQSALFIVFQASSCSRLPIGKSDQLLSSNSSSACPSPCTCQSSGHQSPCPKGGGWREGRGRAVSRPAVWHSPAGSSGSLPLRIFSSHTSTLTSFSHPCQVPGYVHPRPPLPLGLASFIGKCFISPIDGYLGIAALFPPD